MDKTILRYCDSNETDTLAGSLIFDLDKTDWTSDVILSNIINNLKTEATVLSNSIEYTRGNVLSENLRAENKIADDDFVCFKQFVKANTYLPDAKQSQDALDIWELISSHDVMLHKLSYEKQIALSKSLLSNLASEKFKPKVDGLIGVADRLEKFSSSSVSLEAAYTKEPKANTPEVEVIAPSVQKNTVHKIINKQLIPYLENAARAVPEQYQEIYQLVCAHLQSVNTKARARKTRNSSDESEVSTTE